MSQLVHPHLTHPRTGAPITALGFTRHGRPIWPALGASGEAGAAGQPPAPAAAPAPPAPAPAPPAPPAKGVPWRELPLEDQVDYWMRQSRRHESRQLEALGLAPGELDALRAAAAERDRLAESGRTEAQQAVAEAEARGRQAALAEVGGKLVDAHFRVAIGSRMTGEQVTTLLSSLDMGRFQTDGGDVDADAVARFVSTLLPAAAAPAPPAEAAPQSPAATAGTTGAPVTGTSARPDLGQGERQIARPSGLAAGREIAAARYGAKARSAPNQQ